MLRPATPLAIIFFLAFVLLLLSTISTPIIKQIPLGSYQGYDFGVFGWCNGDRCEGPRIGYTTGKHEHVTHSVKKMLRPVGSSPRVY